MNYMHQLTDCELISKQKYFEGGYLKKNVFCMFKRKQKNSKLLITWL